MVLNARCNECKEPSKYVAGCWDGINGIGDFIYICKNEECEIKQIVRTMEAEDIKRRIEVQTANGQKRNICRADSSTQEGSWTVYV